MTENEPDPADDPWLTLAEIAEERRGTPPRSGCGSPADG